ncbi:MAG: Dephospho-CoA kinase [Chlamydiae bacterium]|nr:Dephospho-CoA kinase [Chlamydiota bacterium]
MLKLKKVAVTGGISSGKSLACNCFAGLGAYVVKADEIVHNLLIPDTKLGKKVIELLGSEIVVDNKIDRNRIAKKVFLNPKLLRLLEELLHPAVYEEIEKEYQKVTKTKNTYTLFVAEVPLLFESKGERYFDYTVAAIADREICWERYRKTTGYEREDFNRRSARQLRQSEKAERSDFVIKNNGSADELQKEVKKIADAIHQSGNIQE